MTLTTFVARSMLLAGLLFPCPTVAQRTTEPTRASDERFTGALVIKSGLEPAQPPRIEPLQSFPIGFSFPQLAQIFASLGLNPSAGPVLWELTPGILFSPRTMDPANILSGAQAFMGFYNLRNIGPTSALLDASGRAELYVRPPVVGPYYMISCNVSPASGAYSFSGGGRSYTFNDTGSLIAIFRITEMTWVKFKIQREGAGGEWTFHSCRMGRA